MLRRALFSGARRRYEPWERSPYKDFPNRVLIVGGGFAGYKAAQTLCELARDRDDVGVMLISRENYFTFWPMLASVIGGDVATQNVAQPLAPDPDPARRQLQAGSSGQRRPGKAARGGRRQGVPLRASRALAGGRACLLRHTRRGGALHKHKGDRRRRGHRRQGHRALRGGDAGGGRDPRLQADLHGYRGRGDRGRGGLGTAQPRQRTCSCPTTPISIRTASR